MMNKKEFLVLIATTVFVIIIWIAADIYHTKATVPVSSDLQQAVQPFDPTIDPKTLDRIQKINTPSLQSPPAFVPSESSTPKPSPRHTATPLPIAPIPTASATGSTSKQPNLPVTP